MALGDLSAQFTLEAGFQYAPALDEVAALLRARLYVDGQQYETFTSATRPTDTQASDLITTAASFVRARAGTDIPEGLWATASHVTSLRAAMLIETSYFPEQTDGDDTAYARYREMFEEGLDGLLNALADQATTGGDRRIGNVVVTSPTVAAYYDVYGIDLSTTDVA